MNTTIPAHIQVDADRAEKAAHNKDWSLHAHICRRYPFGSPERKQFDAVMSRIASERRAANPPQY